MDQALEHSHKSYRIINVWKRLDSPRRLEIVNLWVGCKVLNHAQAWDRVDEVVFAIRNPDGRLIGVNTVLLARLPSVGERYYLMRMFLRPEERRDPGLSATVSRLTREFLAGVEVVGSPPKGLAIVTENHKYQRPGGRRFLARNDWNYLGKGPKETEIWYMNFDGSLLPGTRRGGE